VEGGSPPPPPHRCPWLSVSLGLRVTASSVVAMDAVSLAALARGCSPFFTAPTHTFTNTQYVDRGIIPRAISMIFNEFKKRSDMKYQCYISYLEIYLESGYDLLDADHETTKVSLTQSPLAQFNSIRFWLTHAPNAARRHEEGYHAGR